MNYKVNPKYHTVITKIDHKLYIQLMKHIQSSKKTKSAIARKALEMFINENK